MKFSIGDNVVLKRTGEEGRVLALVGKDMVEVEVNGTAFPVYLDDVDHPYLKWFTEKKPGGRKASPPEQLPVEKAPAQKERLARGVYLSFVPVLHTVEMEEQVQKLKVFLLNEMPVPVRFTYDVRRVDNSLFRHEGTLHAFGNLYLHSIDYDVMHDQPRLQWTAADAGNATLATEEGVVRIKPAKLFEHVTAILQGNAPSFTYRLTDAFKEKKAPEPPPRKDPTPRGTPMMPTTARNIEAPKQELDLHIEQLRANPKALSNAEIVKIQLDTLHHYVQLAIVHRQDRMIVIHGMGKGRLREEVHAALKAIPEVSRYKNEWSGRYGFGATEVTFRY